MLAFPENSQILKINMARGRSAVGFSFALFYQLLNLFPTVNSKLASLFSEDVSIVFGNSGQDPDTLSLTHTHTLIRTPSPSLSSHL